MSYIEGQRFIVSARWVVMWDNKMTRSMQNFQEWFIPIKALITRAFNVSLKTTDNEIHDVNDRSS